MLLFPDGSIKYITTSTQRMSAHLSDTQGIDKETLLKMSEPGDIFSALNTQHLREKFYKERISDTY